MKTNTKMCILAVSVGVSGLSNAATFDCINYSNTSTTVPNTNYVTQYKIDANSSTPIATDMVVDARNSTFITTISPYGAAFIREETWQERDVCFAGGYMTSDKAWDATWDLHKYGMPAKNSVGFDNRVLRGTLTGAHVFNTHDGVRVTGGKEWVIQDTWMEYVRDDAVEDDKYNGGLIKDVLIDGTYSGISTRGAGTTVHLEPQTVSIDGMLLRLEATPWPYKWDTKGPFLNASGDVWDDESNDVPYGHGNFFKIYNSDNSTGNRDTVNNHFQLKDIVLAGSNDNIGSAKFNLPATALVDACENVTIAYLGDDTFEYDQTITDMQAKFPCCISIVTGQAARTLWQSKVQDWHVRHPNVDAARKPAVVDQGIVTFPRTF